ncbi:MAG: Fur family transcriptional regulator [Bacteroidia bacterium]
MHTEKELRKLLRVRGLRSSMPRLQILRLLQEGAKSYYDFLDRLAIDRVSLYRNLRDLEMRGLLHKVVSMEGDILYFLCDVSYDAHVHLVCRQCYKTWEIKAERLSVMQGFRPAGGVIWGDCGEHS